MDIIEILKKLNQNQNHVDFDDIDFFKIMNEDTLLKTLPFLTKSRAQLRQDIFAWIVNGFKINGFFVEFGATDGIYLSNTFLLENEFHWKGILAEPAQIWQSGLKENRNGAIIDNRCVFIHDNQILNFREVEADEGLSTLDDYISSDAHVNARNSGHSYPVKTISLNSLLREHNAPAKIDYLSIDTEGSEFDILNSFEFKNYSFNVITCEHNYSSNRNKILALLNKNGYIRVLNRISLFDDWYIHQSLVGEMDNFFPSWKEMSHQENIDGNNNLTDKDKVIVMLQQTINNLIIDRDHYKAGLEDIERQDDILLLQKTINDLITDRDHYKATLENNEQQDNILLLQQTINDLIIDRDHYKHRLENLLNMAENRSE